MVFFRQVSLFVTVMFVMAVTSLAQDIGQGIELFEDGEYADALQVFERITAAEPANASARTYLGLTLAALDRFDDAVPYLDATPDLDAYRRGDLVLDLELPRGERPIPSPDEVLIAKARVHISRGNQNAEATRAFADAARVNPENGNVFYHRGMFRIRTNDFMGAVDDLERALDLDPSNAMSHYYAGLAYSRLGRSDRMVEHFQLFLRMEPEAPEAARVRSLMRAIR